MRDDSDTRQDGLEDQTHDSTDAATEADATGGKNGPGASASHSSPLSAESPLPSFLQEDHLTPLIDNKSDAPGDDEAPEHGGGSAASGIDGDEDSSGIPWRGMPSIAADEPLPLGVLTDGDDMEGIVTQSAEQAQELVFEDGCPGCGHGFDPDGGEEELAEHGEDDAHPADLDRELVLGVKFRQYGPVYFFRAGQEKIRPDGKVLVETEQGVSLAHVISARKMRLPLPKLRTAEGEELEIKSILGLAGPQDIAAAADNQILASSSRLFCKECIRKRNLDMKLVDVEVLHDRSKIIFYFTAPSRIDFRDLVKDLVRNYRTRIELRQIGVRHETQMIGALGNCGMTCCCRRYLRRFAPVTIKMAKEQNLFLNPAKLSGICGRLLCCLSYEQENYEEFHKKSPKLGKKYQTANGTVRVLRANLFRQSIVVQDESGNETEMQLDEWQALEPKRLDQNSAPQPQGNRPPARPRKNSNGPEQGDDPAQERNRHDPEGKKNRKREHDRPKEESRAETLPPADDSVCERKPSGRVYPPGFDGDAERLREMAEAVPGSEALPDNAPDAAPVNGVNDAAKDAPGTTPPGNTRDDDDGDGSIFGLPGSRYHK